MKTRDSQMFVNMASNVKQALARLNNSRFSLTWFSPYNIIS